MADDFGLKIGIEGEREFKAALKDINQQFKVLGSEMKLVESQFDKQDRSVSALTSRNEVLTRQITEQKEKIELLRRALENSAESFGENDQRTKQWTVQLNNAQAQLNNMERELKDNEKAINGVGDEFQSAEKKADGFGDEVKEAANKADDAQDRFRKLGDTLKTIGRALAIGIVAIGTAAIAAGTALVGMTVDAAAYADDMLTQSSITGMSVEKLQAYSYAADLVDVSLETMTTSMAKNIKSMSNASQGSAKFADAYSKLGVSVTNADGTLRDSEAVYWEVIDENQIDAKGLVNEVLVEGGDKLLAIASHSASQAVYGRREGYLSASNLQEGLSEYGQAYLNRVAYPAWGIQGTVTKFSDDRGNRMKPFESYLIGDWIGWNIAPEGFDELGFDGVLRVCGITVSEDDDTGDLSYTLELHDTMLEHEIRLNQKVERMSQYSGSDVLSVAPSSSGGYSDSEVNAMLEAKANVNHLHTGVYSELDHTHDFLALSDTPDSYLGQGAKVVAVKADGSGLEFVTNSGGGSSIGGCLAWVTFNGITNDNVSGTYAQSGTTVTVTLEGHGYKVGHMIYADITSGSGVDGAYKITAVDEDTFQYTAGTSLTTSGNITLRRCAIRRGGGIHSVSDLSTGYYAINFANELPDENYAFSANACEPSTTTANASVAAADPSDITNMFLGLTCEDLDGGYIDCPVVAVTIFG